MKRKEKLGSIKNWLKSALSSILIGSIIVLGSIIMWSVGIPISILIWLVHMFRSIKNLLMKCPYFKREWWSRNSYDIKRWINILLGFVIITIGLTVALTFIIINIFRASEMDANVPTILVAIFTLLLAIATVFLASVTFRSNRQRREQEERDRKERIYLKINDWAIEFGSIILENGHPLAPRELNRELRKNNRKDESNRYLAQRIDLIPRLTEIRMRSVFIEGAIKNTPDIVEETNSILNRFKGNNGYLGLLHNRKRNWEKYFNNDDIGADETIKWAMKVSKCEYEVYSAIVSLTELIGSKLSTL